MRNTKKQHEDQVDKVERVAFTLPSELLRRAETLRKKKVMKKAEFYRAALRMFLDANE